MSTVSGLLLETDLAMKPFLEQTVVRQGSSVFWEAKVPKPNASECSRRSLNERVCGEEPDTVLILMENPG